MPNGKKTRSVTYEQKVKLTPEQRNEARDFDSYKQAFATGKGILADPFKNATTPEGKLQSMQWKKGFGSARRNFESQGFTFGEPIENTSNYPAAIQGSDPTARTHQKMYDAEQKRNARREKFSNIIQIGDNVANAASETTKNVMQKAQNFKEGFVQKKNNFTSNFQKN